MTTQIQARQQPHRTASQFASVNKGRPTLLAATKPIAEGKPIAPVVPARAAAAPRPAAPNAQPNRAEPTPAPASRPATPNRPAPAPARTAAPAPAKPAEPAEERQRRRPLPSLLHRQSPHPRPSGALNPRHRPLIRSRLNQPAPPTKPAPKPEAKPSTPPQLRSKAQPPAPG